MMIGCCQTVNTGVPCELQRQIVTRLNTRCQQAWLQLKPDLPEAGFLQEHFTLTAYFANELQTLHLTMGLPGVCPTLV